MIKNSLFLFALILSLSSCAKVSYLAEQGVGQIKLLTTARDNHWVINDPETPQEIVQKIQDIEVYKEFFEHFWDFNTGRIYTRTTFLEQPAVSYLLISSKKHKISALETRFPIVGRFPYLGFFNHRSAQSWAEKLQRQGLDTYIRPVYAYSTLGYFSDTILSSFFYFDSFDLAELIFHELFHLYFFIPGEVNLNEALATYIGREMAFLYFETSSEMREAKWDEYRRNARLSAEVASQVHQLNKKLKKLENKESIDQYFETLMKTHFKQHFMDFCRNKGIAQEKCFPLNRKWSQASLAAFMTYYDLLSPIEKLHNRLDVDIKGLFGYIEGRYQQYLQLPRDQRGELSEFLFNEF